VPNVEANEMKTWSDIAVLCCPKCGRYYVDASWYVLEIGSDIECGHCEEEFNSKKNATDRAILEFQIDEKGKVHSVKITKHLKLE
jgi:hypothetical protein